MNTADEADRQGAADAALHVPTLHLHRRPAQQRLPRLSVPPKAKSLIRMTLTADLRYHVPKNQCYEGSAGRQSGKVHLHVTGDLFSPPLVRKAGATLCGKRGWYERHLDDGEVYPLCPLCVKRAGMYGVAFPNPTNESENTDA